MLSVLDIILISIGGLAVVTYTTLKILQVKKWQKIVRQGIADGLTEQQAKDNADKLIYKKKRSKAKDVNDDDIIVDD